MKQFLFCSQGHVRERRCVVLEHLFGIQDVTEIVNCAI